MSNIMTARSEYANRPADERFPTYQAMIDHANQDKERCREKVYNLRDLSAVATDDKGNRDSTNLCTTVRLASPKGMADFTNYSFGQLARTIGAPASYLRTLPPSVAADAINFGLHERAPVGQTANVLIRMADGTSTGTLPTVRACTSETYGRLWDGPFHSEINRWFGDGVRSNGGVWQSPPVWPGNPDGGQYRGDRDSFVIRVDGGSIVNDPRGYGSIGQSGGQLFRGIMIRNSEVGECSVTIDSVLFDRICGNHILWGAVIDRQFRRRHVGNRVTRDTINELLAMARKFNQRSASQDEAIIASLVQHEIAITKEAVIDELKKLGATKEQATEAYNTAEQKEPSLNPRSFWAISAGLTRNSQDSGYQNERLALDQLAASVLAKGVKQYVTV